MNNYKKQLEKQLKEIDELINKSNKVLLRLNDLPDDKIITSKSNGCDQYYWYEKETHKRRYVKKNEYKTLRKIAQRDYQIEINKKLYMLKNELERFLEHYDIEKINFVYSRMAEARKKLITPLVEPDDLFVQRWLDDEYESMPINDDTGYYSNNAVRVRSKSELIIANQLEIYGIPYKYEKTLILSGNKRVRPDFICLNIHRREEFVWEHLGMMDNGAYASNNVIKINSYQQNGYLPGKNLILSFETSTKTLSSIIVNQIIENYLIL